MWVAKCCLPPLLRHVLLCFLFSLRIIFWMILYFSDVSADPIILCTSQFASPTQVSDNAIASTTTDWDNRLKSIELFHLKMSCSNLSCVMIIVFCFCGELDSPTPFEFCGGLDSPTHFGFCRGLDYPTHFKFCFSPWSGCNQSIFLFVLHMVWYILAISVNTITSNWGKCFWSVEIFNWIMSMKSYPF